MGKWAAAKERHLAVQSKYQRQRRQEQPAVMDLDSDAGLDGGPNKLEAYSTAADSIFMEF